MTETKRGPGYYPDFSTLDQREFWDDATRAKIEQRLDPDKPIRFFTSTEARTMQAVLNCVMPQDDRAEDRRIPVLALIDERLHTKKFDGFTSIEGTPDDDAGLPHRPAGRRGVGPGQTRRSLRRARPARARGCPAVAARRKSAGAAWPEQELPPKHFWQTVIRDAAAAYYAHPYAWDEIGFGGPAYPRGYFRLTEGLPEPWESDEKRYDWHAPADTRSDSYVANAEYFTQPRKKD